MQKLSRKTAFIIAALIGCSMTVVFLIWPRCSYSCRAHALYKNKIFFELRDAVSDTKKVQPDAIHIASSRFTESLLRENGVGYWGVTESGAIFLGDLGGNVLLVAEPKVVSQDVVWRCRFYPRPIEIPMCPSERQPK
jgi:hypothetical protein